MNYPKLVAGNRRYVFVVGNYVFKIPRFRIFRYIRARIVLRKEPRLIKIYFPFRRLVFGGLLENIREVQCFRNTKHKLLAPVLLPLIIVNVYRKENGVGNFSFKGDELFYMVGEIYLGKVKASRDPEFFEAFRRCSHTFDHSDNFAFDGIQVKILDYGEKGFQDLLLNYGDLVEELLLSVANK